MGKPVIQEQTQKAKQAKIVADNMSQILENAMDSIDQGFVVWDEDECLVVCNESFRSLWGYPKKLVQPGTSSLELLKFDAAQGLFGEGDPDVLAEQRMQDTKDHHVEGSDEVFEMSNGRVMYIRRKSVQNLGMLSTFTDITDLKRTEDKLAEKSSLLEKTLNSIDQGVAIWNSDKELQISNDSFRRLMDYPKELVQPGTQSIELLRHIAKRGEFGDGDPEELARQYHGRTLTNLAQKTDELCTFKNGRSLYIRRYTTSDSGCVSTFTDVTELQQTEDALRINKEQLQEQVKVLRDNEEKLELQKAELVRANLELEEAHADMQLLNAQKDKFFSIIAHDLRGPFNVFLGYSSLIAEKSSTMDQSQITDAAQTIKESAQRLNKLLENLLEWSQLHMGRIEFEPTSLDIHEIVDRNLSLYTLEAINKKIQLKNLLNKPSLVYADPQMTDSIIRNLISNAIKFTDVQGKITIDGKSVNGNLLEITVSDTGVGIEPKKVKTLFNLEQITSTYGTRGEAGTGLGLQLCKEFAHKQNGSLTVQSVVGEGSQFRIRLPKIS